MSPRRSRLPAWLSISFGLPLQLHDLEAGRGSSSKMSRFLNSIQQSEYHVKHFSLIARPRFEGSSNPRSTLPLQSRRRIPMQRLVLFCSLAAALGLPPQASDGPPSYPAAARGDTTDVYFGIEVADPYRWLEELDGAETSAWVEAQNALSKPFLENLPRHPEISKRLEEVWNYERFGTPRKEGGRYFYLRNDGLQDGTRSTRSWATVGTSSTSGRPRERHAGA